MNAKIAPALTFSAAVALSLIAASTRFGDSAHAMGVISERGGRPAHAVHLPPNRDRYTLIVTTRVLPPYTGDIEVSVHGPAWPRVSVRASRPVVDLGVRRRPSFRDSTFFGTEAGDRLSMWLVIKPPPADPACGQLRTRNGLPLDQKLPGLWFCSEACRRAYVAGDVLVPVDTSFEGSYDIVFRDRETSKDVLRIPLVFGSHGSKAGQHHGH